MSELLDLLARNMADSDRPWTPEEIAEKALKLTSKGPATAHLVRAVVGSDPRFSETGEGWSLRPREVHSPLREPVRLAWFEKSNDGQGVRVHTALWTQGSGLTDVVALSEETPPPGRLWSHPWASVQPAIASRWLRRMDRLWACGEPPEPFLDLLAWSRVLLRQEGVTPDAVNDQSQLERLVERWGVGPLSLEGEGPLRALAGLLDHILETCPRWDWDEVERRRVELLESRALDWSDFRFDRAHIDSAPECSGVYRLTDSYGVSLYVGKSSNLKRRLSEHFRDLPPEPTKREEMLSQVRGVEWQELSSELEALVLEHRTITDESPSWNVQVEIHRPERFPAEWVWPLIYVTPDSDEVHSVIVLMGPDEGTLLTVAENTHPDEVESILQRLMEPELADQPDSAPEHALERRLRPAEVWLCLRYFSRHRDRVLRIDTLSLTSPTGVAEAVCRLARDRASEARDGVLQR